MTAQARRRHRSLGIIAAVSGVAIAIAWTASAQTSSMSDNGRVLHRDLAPPTGAKAADVGAPAVFGNKPAEGQNPSAFAAGAKILPEPSKDSARASGEPVHGRGGFAADRDTQARPDYQTGSDSTLQYATVFNPSVIPFKRMSALDRVRADYTLYTESAARETLRIGGKRRAGRDLFWGSLVVHLETGKDVAIPSVSPEMRILSYELAPDLKSPLTFSKDDADNYYIRTDEAGISGDYRLVFLADADTRYFTGDVPGGYTVRSASRRGRALIHALPPAVQRVAERALRRLRVHRDLELKVALDRLVAYFRDYEAKDDPIKSSGDIYWDLFTSQAGVCRHRSFVFMVTANAVGIPTRYVTNEAHAWVEVWVPDVNWIRIDLGGAALRMDVSNGKDKTIYRPRHKDQFPRPDKYSSNYTQLRGDIRGLSKNQLAEAHDDSDPKTTPDWDVNGPDPGQGDPNTPQIGPGKSLPALPDKATRNKVATTITVDDSVAPFGFRGEPVKVSGKLVDDTGSGVDQQLVNIWLAPSGKGGDNAILVGSGRTDKDGKFTAEIELPKDLSLRAYEVFASTAGDKKFAPAVSR